MFFFFLSDSFRNFVVVLLFFCCFFFEEVVVFIFVVDLFEVVIFLEGLRSRNVLFVDFEVMEVFYEFYLLMWSFLESVGNGFVFK